MDIFWRLLLGHLLADFTLQTNFINRWKRVSFWGMLAHCSIHLACSVLLTCRFLADPWIGAGALRVPGWACVLLLFAAHLLEDQWRALSIFRKKAPDNTFYFFWDQVIHGAVIFAVFPLGLAGGGMTLVPEKWLVLGCLLVLVTDASTVTGYFLEKDLCGRGFPGFDEKYLCMAERLVLGLCFLLPQNGWLIAAPAWLAAMCLLRARGRLDLSWFSFGFGSVASIACGLCARAVYYS